MRCGFPNKRRGRLPLPEKENHWAWSSSGNEKGRMSVVVEVASVDQAEDEGYEFTGTLHTINTDDPFPIDPHSSLEERQSTIRAILVGCLLGAVIATRNVHLRLKVRPSNSIFDVPRLDVANLIRPGGRLVYPPLAPSLALPFSNLKPLSTGYLGGGYVYPKENNVVQATASAAGSLGLLFTSDFPAASQFGLSATPS